MTSNSRRRFRGIAAGYRSGLEEDTGDELKSLGIPYEYESVKLEYVVPQRTSKYTPDFKLPKPGGFFLLETKGLWVTADRQKHILIKQQHPNVDLRILFQNANSKLYKGSKTTYGQFATKNGLVWAHKRIPDEWIDEMKAAANKK